MRHTKEVLQQMANELAEEYNSRYSVKLTTSVNAEHECIIATNGRLLLDCAEDIYLWAAKYDATSYIECLCDQIEIHIFV